MVEDTNSRRPPPWRPGGQYFLPPRAPPTWHAMQPNSDPRMPAGAHAHHFHSTSTHMAQPPSAPFHSHSSPSFPQHSSHPPSIGHHPQPSNVYYPTHSTPSFHPSHSTPSFHPSHSFSRSSMASLVHAHWLPQEWTPSERTPSTGFNGHQHGHYSHWAGQPPCSRQLRAPHRSTVIMNTELKVPRSCRVSVLCYNILAQDLLENNPSLYSERDPAHLNWEYRKTKLLSELCKESADIMCLQEMQESAYTSWFSPQLSEQGYTGLYKKRTGDYTDGCALFYKQSKLTLLEHKELEFQKGYKVLNRDNVGIIAKFVPVGCDSDASFCMATTHLLYNPKAGDVKLAQLGYLFAELHRMATIPGTKEVLLPVLLCGDFNSVPTSYLCEFVTTSYLDYSNVSAVEIAGYHRRRRGRWIPHPLFPSCSMAIGNDCVYTKTVAEAPNQVHTVPMDTGSGSETKASPTMEKNDKCTVSTQSTPGGRDLTADVIDLTGSSDTTSASQSEGPIKQDLSHPFKLTSVYPYLSTFPKSTVTTYHQCAFETVDYIFFTPHSASKGFHPLHRKGLPSTDVLLQLGPQPHQFISSDHLLLRAVFQLVW